MQTRRQFLKAAGLAAGSTAILGSPLQAGRRGGQKRPNILWITSEDNSISWISCYGSKNAKTPAIDKLAEEGFQYLYCFDNAAVCAPTRSCWITGMYAISNGTQPMRSRNGIPHDKIKYYPDLLRKASNSWPRFESWVTRYSTRLPLRLTLNSSNPSMPAWGRVIAGTRGRSKWMLFRMMRSRPW